MLINKEFCELSQFKGRNVELFRSSDENSTAIYFTNVSYGENKTAKAHFELLRFGYESGIHQIYIKYPNTNHFVEMFGGGMGSSRGDMMTSSGKNIWNKQYDSEFRIYSCNDDLMLLIGNSDFNFMKRVASYNKGNPYSTTYPNETFINYNEIEEALSHKFLKLPESVRKIEYCCKTKDETPKYIIIDYPVYNFSYDNFRFRVVEDLVVKEFKIKRVERYRDGGTTIIKVEDENGCETDFFSPTPFSKASLSAKWGEFELTDVTEIEKNELVKFLNIILDNNLINEE